jgi:hypothetical protein
MGVNNQLKYCDLKFNMCTFLQEYHKLKTKQNESDEVVRSLREALKQTGGAISPSDNVPINRSLKDLLQDIDHLAEQKLNMIGLKSKLSEISSNEKKQNGGLILTPSKHKDRAVSGGRDPGNGTIFKDRSVDASRNSHMSARSNISKRYENNDDSDGDEQSEEMNDRNNCTPKYNSFCRNSNNQKSTNSISTPDKSLIKVRGISPIGPNKQENSFGNNSCFLSPEKYFLGLRQ